MEHFFAWRSQAGRSKFYPYDDKKFNLITKFWLFQKQAGLIICPGLEKYPLVLDTNKNGAEFLSIYYPKLLSTSFLHIFRGKANNYSNKQHDSKASNSLLFASQAKLHAECKCKYFFSVTGQLQPTLQIPGQ